MRISFQLNEERFVLDVTPTTSLASLLREEFGIKSVQSACGHGVCGSCLVLMNNQIVPACLVPAFSVRDSVIETIEGLSGSSSFADIEKGFIKTPFSPCANCAASKALLAEGLLRLENKLNRQVIENNLPSHWCSCTTQDSFVQAVLLSWDLRRKRSKT